MKQRARLVSLLLAVVAALAATAAGCGGPAVSDPAGSWTLAEPESTEASLEALHAAGMIPAGADALARSRLAQLRFELELAPGGSFRCTMGLAGALAAYRGTWTSEGSSVEILQTHEDEREVADRMSGRVDRDLLRLEHVENGTRMPYVLRRSASASAPR